MGKGTNATHINEGLYTVDYQYDTDAITARIAMLTARLAELNSEQVTLASDISTKEFNISSKEDTIDQNIDDLNDLKSELQELNSDLDEANGRLDEIPDEITEQEDLLTPIDARMLVITIFLSPIQASIASKQAALAEATDPDVIAQLTSEIEALQEQETILSDEYDDLNEQKTPSTTAISDLETEQSTLQETVSTLECQIASKETGITTLRNTKHSNESDLSDYRAELLQLEADLAANKLQIASTQKSIDALSAIPTSIPGTYAWCADLTEDLSGEVGIMEVAGFEDSGINIQPGYEGNAVYDSDRDGIAVPAEATSSAQAFWNRAMQGGWQKWRPTFRWGTITVIDYDLDTCSVTMSTATNPDTGLDVNKEATLTDVPIEYMSCNSAPFAVGDTVVVKFTGQSWDDPVVIGFTSEPKKCTSGFIIFATTFHDEDAVEQILYTVWDVEAGGIAKISYDDESIVLPIQFPNSSSIVRASPFGKWMAAAEYEALEDAIEFVPGEGSPGYTGGCSPYPGVLGDTYGLQECFSSGESGDYKADMNTALSAETSQHSPYLSRAMKNTNTGGWIGTKAYMPRVRDKWEVTADAYGLCTHYKTMSETVTIYSPLGDLWTGNFPYLYDYDKGPPNEYGQCTGSIIGALKDYKAHYILQSEIYDAGRPKNVSTFIKCLRSTIRKSEGGDYGDFILHTYLTSFVIKNINNGAWTYTYVTELRAGIKTYLDDVDASAQNPLSVTRTTALETALISFFNTALDASEDEAPTDIYDATEYRPKEIKKLLTTFYRGTHAVSE